MLVAEALQQGRFPPGRAVSVTLQVAHEIASTHRKDQLRLSLSTRELELKGEDLDLAPPGKTATEYSAPEQLSGTGVDRRTDVYLVGALLYHLVTGHRPAGQKVAPPPVPPEDGMLEIFVIIDQCLEPNREERYATMESLVDDLEAVRRLLETLASKAPVASHQIHLTGDLTPVSDREKEAPPPEEEEKSSSGMIMVLVICLIGTVLFWWLILR